MPGIVRYSGLDITSPNIQLLSTTLSNSESKNAPRLVDCFLSLATSPSTTSMTKENSRRIRAIMNWLMAKKKALIMPKMNPVIVIDIGLMVLGMRCLAIGMDILRNT